MTHQPRTLGETIFLARKRLGLSQEALGTRIGRTAVAICNWEKERCGPNNEIIPLRAQVLDLPVEDLINRAHVYHPKPPQTGAQILVQRTARYLIDQGVTLTPEQALSLLKKFKVHIKALKKSVDPPTPNKSRRGNLNPP